MKDKICYTLKELGVPPHLLGFDYLVEAIELVHLNHDLLHAITKELYPAIAERHHTTGSKVERAIRNAIEMGFDNSTPELLKSVFGNTINMHSGKVANSHFIATITEVLDNEPNHPIFDGSIFEGEGSRNSSAPSTYSASYSGRFA